jgi:hypothetical protein
LFRNRTGQDNLDERVRPEYRVLGLFSLGWDKPKSNGTFDLRLRAPVSRDREEPGGASHAECDEEDNRLDADHKREGEHHVT